MSENTPSGENTPTEYSNRDPFIQAAYGEPTFLVLATALDELEGTITNIQADGVNRPQDLLDRREALIAKIAERRDFLHDIWDRSHGSEELFRLNLTAETLDLKAQEVVGSDEYPEAFAKLRHAKDNLRNALARYYTEPTDGTDQ